MSTNTPGANKATRIRKRIREGKEVPLHQLEWLEKYEAEHPIGRRGRLTAKEAFSPRPPTGEESSESSPGSAPSQDSSRSEGVAAPTAASAPAAEVPALPVGGDIPPPELATPPTPPTNPDGTPAPAPPLSPAAQKEAAVTQLVEMAAGAWKIAIKRVQELTEAKEPMFPDAFIDKLWKPAATRLGVKYLPDSVGGDLADALIVVGPPVATGVVLKRVSDIKAKEKKLGGAAPAPTTQAQEQRAESDAPHAVQPATGQTAGDLKMEIRRTKAPEMGKDAIF